MAREQGKVTLEGGLSLTISVGDAAGLQAQLGPKISVAASISASRQACVTATAAIEASVKLFANVLFVKADLVLYSGEYYKSTIFSKGLAVGSSNGTVSGSGSTSGTGSPQGGSGGGSSPSGPPSVAAANNNGQMQVHLANLPLGTACYFCHAGDGAGYPTSGAIIDRGQLTLTSYSATFQSGLCATSGNAWIGLQASNGADYYSNQVTLSHVTPGVTAANNNGQMAVQLSNFPLGTTYFFCHSGDPSTFPTGGVVTTRGQLSVTSSSASYRSVLCSGRGNAWIGLQATDGADYYSNQTNLVAAPTPGASITATSSPGQLNLQVTNFPLGVTYYFCHSGDPSQYPTGGAVPSRGQFTVSTPNQSFASLCGGSGNFWIGLQATDGHDYYSNQVPL